MMICEIIFVFLRRSDCRAGSLLPATGGCCSWCATITRAARTRGRTLSFSFHLFISLCQPQPLIFLLVLCPAQGHCLQMQLTISTMGSQRRFYLIQWSLSNMEKTGKLRKAVASCYAAYFSSSALHIISPAPILQKEMDFKLACCVPRTCSGLLKKLLSVARTQLKMIIFKGVCLFRFLLNAFNCYGILCCQGVAYGIFFFPVQIF